MSGFQFHAAIVTTTNGEVRLPVRASEKEAKKDGVAFCNGHRHFRVVGLLNSQALPLLIKDRLASRILEK